MTTEQIQFKLEEKRKKLNEQITYVNQTNAMKERMVKARIGIIDVRLTVALFLNGNSAHYPIDKEKGLQIIEDQIIAREREIKLNFI